MNNITYYTRINLPEDRLRLGEDLHIGPAYKKVMAVSDAIGRQGVDFNVVTIPVYSGKFVFLGKKFFQKDSFLIKSYPGFGVPALDRLYSAFVFTLIAVRNRSDKYILYNFFPEYIPAATFFESNW